MDLWHMSNEIFCLELFFRNRCSVIHFEFSKQPFGISIGEKFLAREIEYTDSSRLLIARLRREEKSFGNRETLSRHRQVMSESWYFWPCAWRKFAGEIAKIFVSRFTEIVILCLRIRQTFVDRAHDAYLKWSRIYLEHNARTFQGTIRPKISLWYRQSIPETNDQRLHT